MEKIILNNFVEKIREIHKKNTVPLHEPVFFGNEKLYLSDAIDSTFVSYEGRYVNDFEKKVSEFAGAKYAVSVVNGTSALHAALLACDVRPTDEVITQALTFVATANAISYCGAKPVFLDVDDDTMGLSPNALQRFLDDQTCVKNGSVTNVKTGRRISCIVPMHTFGIPARIEEICSIAKRVGLPVIEDAAEALGSYSDDKHMGSFGKFGVFSFNANKIITSGGGGMIITDDENAYHRLTHITKTSKIQHKFEFYHDEIGYNYRLPNINACVGVAQFERISEILSIKKDLANFWSSFFQSYGVKIRRGSSNDTINNWLFSIQLSSRKERDEFLEYTNNAGIATRPIWTLMSELPMFKNATTDNLKTSQHLSSTIVSIPSGVPGHLLEKNKESVCNA